MELEFFLPHCTFKYTWSVLLIRQCVKQITHYSVRQHAVSVIHMSFPKESHGTVTWLSEGRWILLDAFFKMADSSSVKAKWAEPNEGNDSWFLIFLFFTWSWSSAETRGARSSSSEMANTGMVRLSSSAENSQMLTSTLCSGALRAPSGSEICWVVYDREEL